MWKHRDYILDILLKHMIVMSISKGKVGYGPLSQIFYVLGWAERLFGCDLLYGYGMSSLFVPRPCS